MKVRYKATLALAFIVFELSFWSIFLKIGGSSIGLIPQLFYGFLVGLAVSLTISLVRDRGKSLYAIAKQPSTLLLIAFMGLLNNAFTQLFLGIGTLGTNPSIGSVVYRSWPIIIALLTPVIVGQKVKKMQMAATVLGFLGIYVILSGGALFSFNIATTLFVGVLLLAALCTSLSGLFMNKYTFDPFAMVVVFNLISLAFITLLSVATGTGLSVSFTTASVISVLFLGVFAYGIGTVLVYYVIKIFGPLLFGNAALTVPFFTIVLSSLITNTQIKVYYILAALLISAGIVLQRSGSIHPERLTKRSSLRGVTVLDVTGAFIGNKNQSIAHKILGGGRAFAIEAPSTGFDEKLHRVLFKGCIVFTNKRPHPDVTNAEIDFINEIMGTKNAEVLIALGNPKDLENGFADFVSAAKN
ncbi:MAG: DMT family transporter [Candidatus Marsarchaeota archaeon]|nr:DMT family transporter [Candidatus Marsarchaeota archaeon]MCL5111814.1 DMT family transporter [Candidatus Marsarchaeota archaeon]